MDEKCQTTSTDLSLIIPNLYLGSIEAACNTQNLKQLGITHILTVDDKPLGEKFQQNYLYKFIRILDLPYVDIICSLNECFQFIDDGIKPSSAILIHCLLGVSRSATVVLAYLMLKKRQTLNDTFEYLKTKRFIRPNNGFLRQLELFEAMNYEIDNNLAAYKLYKLEKLAEQIKKGDNIMDLYLKEKIKISNTSSCANSTGSQQFYKCKKCRLKLFTKENLVRHIKSYKNLDYNDWNSRCMYYKKLNEQINYNHDGLHNELVECTNEIFIEPVNWLLSKIVNLDGKIFCPKCSTKLGSYNWYGYKCTCSMWIIPAFHISQSKVDCPSSDTPATTNELTNESRAVNNEQLIVIDTNPTVTNETI